MQHRHPRHLWLPMRGRPTRVPVTPGSMAIGIRQGHAITGMPVTGLARRMLVRTGLGQGITGTGGTAAIGGAKRELMGCRKGAD